MTAIRGSTHKLVTIKEVTYGVTPTTPTMLEMPLTSWSPQDAQSVMRSAQIRSHPYTDKMIKGTFSHAISTGWELQDAVHDSLFETIFGGTITTKALKFADAIKSITAESQAGQGSLFDQFSGFYLNHLEVTASASDTAPVAVTATGTAKVGTLDASATIASTVTAAANNDPFVFQDASLTVASVATDVVSGNFVLDRAVDPLNIWNSRTAREYVPGAVTATGQITVPYDDSSQSTLLSGFTDAALVFKFGNIGASAFRQFTFPKCKYVSLGRGVTSRGVRLQQINWEAYYDPSSTTICTMTTQ